MANNLRRGVSRCAEGIPCFSYLSYWGAKKKVLMWKERLGNALHLIELVLVSSKPFGTQAIKAMHFYQVVIKKRTLVQLPAA